MLTQQRTGQVSRGVQFGLATLLVTASVCWGQNPVNRGVRYHVTETSDRLEMTVGTSKIMTLDYTVPRLLVQNTDIIQAEPLSPNEVQIMARQPGITAINLWDENGKIQVIDVRVYGDIRELEDTLKKLYPAANLRLQALNSSLHLTGFVPQSDMVGRIVEISEDYFPRVINHLEVGGAQTVLLHVKVMEVSRTKLRRLGIDWALLTDNDFFFQGVNGLISSAAAQSGSISGGGTIGVGIIGDSSRFGAFMDALRQNTLAKILAEPTLVTVSGRAARFLSGGEIPIPVSGGLGVTTVEFREFGTTVDFVPIVQGNGMIKLEVRPEITEVDNALRDPVTGTPGFRARSVDTSVELRAGQTMLLAGLIQRRVDSQNVGIPVLADMPWVGPWFRQVQETQNEIEMLVMVTPELVGPLDPHEVPPCGPGQRTTSPSDVDLYIRGYPEVPKCCPDGSCQQCGGGVIGPIGPGVLYPHEELPSQQPAQGQGTGSADGQSGSNQSARFNYYGKPGRVSPVSRTAPLVRGRSTAAPVVRPNRYRPTMPSNSPQVAPTTTQKSRQNAPALIGPLGYDVLD